MKTQTTPIKWEFRGMAVGDSVRVPASLAARARASVSGCTVYSRGRLFFAVTETPDTGDLLITRVAQCPDPNASWWATRKDDPIYMLLVGE
jgi:hypothetical protein